MKVRIPKPKRQLPPKAINAVNKEIKNQIYEQREIFIKSLLFPILYSVGNRYNKKGEALNNLAEQMVQEYAEMLDFYGRDMPCPAEYKLREMGVDVDKIVKEFLKVDNVELNIR